jgi:hypothetical protein
MIAFGHQLRPSGTAIAFGHQLRLRAQRSPSGTDFASGHQLCLRARSASGLITDEHASKLICGYETNTNTEADDKHQASRHVKLETQKRMTSIKHAKT